MFTNLHCQHCSQMTNINRMRLEACPPPLNRRLLLLNRRLLLLNRRLLLLNRRLLLLNRRLLPMRSRRRRASGRSSVVRCCPTGMRFPPIGGSAKNGRQPLPRRVSTRRWCGTARYFSRVRMKKLEPFTVTMPRRERRNGAWCATRLRGSRKHLRTPVLRLQPFALTRNGSMRFLEPAKWSAARMRARRSGVNSFLILTSITAMPRRPCCWATG